MTGREGKEEQGTKESRGSRGVRRSQVAGRRLQVVGKQVTGKQVDRSLVAIGRGW